MKKKTSLSLALKVCWMYLRSVKKGMLHTDCSLCKGHNLVLERSDMKGNIYTSTYRCLDCGAVASNREVWAAPEKKEV